MNLYENWIKGWERRLTKRDRHRRILPFEWGTEWLEGLQADVSDPLLEIQRWSRRALDRDSRFYQVADPEEVRQADGVLSFRTPSASPYEANNTVTCRIWTATNPESAVVVIPQWNADSKSHVGLCNVLAGLGMTVVRVTLPYHESRTPEDMVRADYMVSPNVGRTLHATRQAVLEVLQVVRWLRGKGIQRIGLVGTSLGSCVAYLAYVHDDEIMAGVFNHVAAYFADVVWTGLSTRFVRWGLERHLDLPDLRVCWAPLSPWFFVDRLRGSPRSHLLITAKYDLTFLPETSAPVFDRYEELGIPYRRIELPCGHYTTAHFPFKYLDGWHICTFLRKHLSPDRARMNRGLKRTEES